MRSVERQGTDLEVKIVRVSRSGKDQDLIAAVQRAGYIAVQIPVRGLSLRFDDLSCTGCVLKAHNALKAIRGVRTARVDRSRNAAAVTYDARHTSSAKIRAALQKAGFKVRA